LRDEQRGKTITLRDELRGELAQMQMNLGWSDPLDGEEALY
jgi:hypothetical protein